MSLSSLCFAAFHHVFHAQLVEHAFQHLALLLGQIAPCLFAQHVENVDAVAGRQGIGRDGPSRRGVGHIAQLPQILAGSGIGKAVAACRAKYPQLEIEVEADSLEDVREAADANVEYILLDNMSNETMVQAIQIIAGRAKTEASGNITLERLPSMRNLGLDYISSGALTHSAKAIDIGLDIITG